MAGLKNGSGKPKTEDTHVYMDVKLRRWLEAEAHKNDRSFAGEIQFILRQAQERTAQ